MRVRPRRPMCWNFCTFFAFIGLLICNLDATRLMILKRKILVTRFPYESRFGGEEVHTLRLMEELDKRGIESFFLGSCPVLLGEFKERGFSVKRAWLAKPPVTLGWLVIFTVLIPILFLRAGLLLGKVRRKWGVDTLYALSFGEKLLITPWAHLFGMKVLWIEHARVGRWLSKNPWRFVYKMWSRWATVVVTSKAMVQFVAPYVKNVVAIPCGVMSAPAEPLPRGLVDFLKGGFAVGSVARLTADKGVDMLVHLVHSKPEVRLIIVGDGPLKMSIQKACDSSRVRLLPSLPRGQLTALYGALDLFVLASREVDPFGMVAAEAMAEGTPVLVTSVCGIASDLHDGREAFIAKPRASEIDKVLKRVMRRPDLRAVVGKQGRAFVNKHYRLETMVAEFERVLRARGYSLIEVSSSVSSGCHLLFPAD